jgi:hypothetical protein
MHLNGETATFEFRPSEMTAFKSPKSKEVFSLLCEYLRTFLDPYSLPAFCRNSRLFNPRTPTAFKPFLRFTLQYWRIKELARLDFRQQRRGIVIPPPNIRMLRKVNFFRDGSIGIPFACLSYDIHKQNYVWIAFL